MDLNFSSVSMLSRADVETKTSCFSLDCESNFFAKIHMPQITTSFSPLCQETTKGLSKKFTSVSALVSRLLSYSRLHKSYFITFWKSQYHFGD